MGSLTRNTLRKKFPSKNEIWSVFSVGVFVTHMWGYILLLYHIPALILRSTVWEIFSVAAYNLVFYLLDSLFISTLILVFCMVLPASYLRDHFTITGSTIIFVFALTAAFIIFTIPIYSVLLNRIQNKELHRIIIGASYLSLLLWLMFTLMISNKIRYKTHLARYYLGFIKRITTLSSLFLVLDGIGVTIVFLRNLI